MAPSFLIFRNVDTWQLIISTLTTIVTFLLVALLRNTQKWADSATQHKFNAIADASADMMEAMALGFHGARIQRQDHHHLRQERDELLAAVGLEDRESAS